MRHIGARHIYSLILILSLLLGAKVAHAQRGWNVQLVANFDTTGTATAVCVANGMAYVADGSDGLKIIDVSNPATPVLKGTFPTNGAAGEIAVKDSFVYLAMTKNFGGGTYVLNVSNPANPSLVTFIKSTGSIGDSGVAVSGSRLFIAGSGGNTDEYFSKLSMFDLTDPSAPRLMDQWKLGRDIGRVSAAGSMAAVAHVETGPMIFDASSSQLRLQGIFYTGDVSDVAFLGRDPVFSTQNEYYRVATRAAGIQTLATDQSTLTPRGAYYTRNEVNALCTNGRMIYAATDTDGLLILEALTLDNLVLKGKYITATSALDVATDGSYLYVANGADGLTILRYTGVTTPITDNAALVRNTIPATMTPGQTASVSVTFANTSPIEWIASDYKLAIYSPLWVNPSPRVSFINGARVKPNDEYTFRFNIKAPAKPGIYKIALSMSHENVKYFGDMLSIPVKVAAPSTGK